MKQFWQLLGATVLSVTVAAGAQAIPLSTLLAGGALKAGGIEFTDFSARYGASDPSRVFDAAQIDVAALAGGPAAGTWLRFDVRGKELTVRGNGVPAFVGLQLHFRAAAADPALAGATVATKSKPVHIRQETSGACIGDVAGSGPGSTGWEFPDTPCDSQAVQWNFPVAAMPVTDPTTLAAQGDLWVRKTMLAWAVDRADTMSLLVFSQQFELQVPEPGSLPLVAAAGLAAAAVLGKKRRGGNGRGDDGPGTDGRGTDGRGTDGRGTDGSGTDGQGNDGQGNDGQGNDGQGNDGRGDDGGREPAR